MSTLDLLLNSHDQISYLASSHESLSYLADNLDVKIDDVDAPKANFSIGPQFRKLLRGIGTIALLYVVGSLLTGFFNPKNKKKSWSEKFQVGWISFASVSALCCLNPSLLEKIINGIILVATFIMGLAGNVL